MKWIFYIVILLASTTSATSASGLDQTMKYKDEIDAYDNILYERDVTYDDIKGWWKIADKLVLALLNDIVKGENFALIYPQGKTIIREGLEIYSSPQNTLDIDYTKWCEPPHAPYELGILIVPLATDNTIYYVTYSRDWINPAEGCNGTTIHANTSYIAEKSEKCGLYEITCRLEETNFYKQETKNLERKSGVLKPSYAWAGSVSNHYSEIQYENRIASFVTSMNMCYPGDPCYYDIYIYWQYGPDKKLKADKYIDKYYTERDPESGELRPTGEIIELEP